MCFNSSIAVACVLAACGGGKATVDAATGDSRGDARSIDAVVDMAIDEPPDAPPDALDAPNTYIKPAQTSVEAFFGTSLALSADGSTLAVGIPNTPNDGRSGAVYIFVRVSGMWSQQAYVKASNAEIDDDFGRSVALSADGATLVVGAPHEDSAATGIDGNQTDNSASRSGAVYVFTRGGTTWSQSAYVKASNTRFNARLGSSVALSDDGATLVAGSASENGVGTGINGDQSACTMLACRFTGAAYVFVRSGTTWSQQAYVKASNPSMDAYFGYSVALSSDASTLAVGAKFESTTAAASGAVYVFTRSGTTWSQQAFVKASNPGQSDYFGNAVTLSDDGSTMVVGADGEASNASGINGNQADDSAFRAGAAYVFTRAGTTWSQQAYVKASNAEMNDGFGRAVSLVGDGSTVVIGAGGESSSATGIDGDQTNNSMAGAGAVYIFERTSSVWAQQHYYKASNTGTDDGFGESVAVSGDRTTLAVGAPREDSADTGVGADQFNDNAPSAGAVYVF